MSNRAHPNPNPNLNPNLYPNPNQVSNRALDAETAYKLTANGCAENAEAFAAG